MSRIKTAIKAALCGVFKHSGVLWAQESLARRRGRSFAVVLLFHRVTDDIPEDGLTVSTQRFGKICRMLRKSFRVVPVAEVVRIVRSGQTVPARTVAITFDDCYRDNLDAARVLAEHGLPASFFIPSAFVGTDHVFPWDRDLPRMPNLSWDDVHEMVRLGFDIGSHTVTHADLGAVSLEQARREAVESKRVLEHRLQKPVRWLAHPFGQRTNLRHDVVPLLQEAGYEACFSGYGGFIYPGCPDFVLPREAVPYFASLLNLELHLTGSLHWMYALKRSMADQSDRHVDVQANLRGVPT
jgi:peptidoglycan/xylan/chitin deacetylase (PgdA/CDA1 family)